MCFMQIANLGHLVAFIECSKFINIIYIYLFILFFSAESIAVDPCVKLHFIREKNPLIIVLE